MKKIVFKKWGDNVCIEKFSRKNVLICQKQLEGKCAGGNCVVTRKYTGCFI